jgi:membrane-bound ClpP family serine protease
MKLSTLLVITAVVALIFGIFFVLVPTTVLSIYGVTQGPAEALMSQYFGTSLIFAGLVAWLMRKVTDASAQRAVVFGFLITDILGVIVSLIGTRSGVMNSVGWTVVVIYLLLAIGFASIQFKKPAAP